MGCQKQEQKNRIIYFVSRNNFRYPWHSLQIGLPLYFGLPSVILPVALFVLQIQQSTIVPLARNSN